MSLSKYHGKGYTGLTNLGNTCFLNACMQVMNHTYELNELLDTKKFEDHIKQDTEDATIVVEWNDLRQVMWSSNGIVSPNKFVFNVHKLAKAKNRDIFTGWAQNDMPEFLLFMIECMHNSISRSVNMRIMGNVENGVDKLATECYGMLKTVYSKEYSEIMDLYYGIYVSEIVSLDGTVTHSIKPESFFMLDLPLPNPLEGSSRAPLSIYECFDEFSKSEPMTGENAWFNEATNQKEDIQKRITFWNFPKILVITLKRFSVDGSNKRSDMVSFPLTDLDLSAYVSGYNPKQYTYDLFGICNHIGDVMGGHYTAHVKNSMNEWVNYNDEKVRVINRAEQLQTTNAYCLFYRRKNTAL